MLSENALKVYDKLYCSGEEGSPDRETPRDVHRRVADFVAGAELTEDDQAHYGDMFFDLMEQNLMRPNSPVLINAGCKPEPQCSACFVGDLSDDLMSILEFDKEAGIIYSQGSGIGGQYGNLREKGAKLSSGGEASGPCSFMFKLGATGKCVKSGGRARRSAHMSLMYDWHPDVLEFITIKEKYGKELEGMNLSIAVSDDFMDAVEVGELWELRGVVDGKVKQSILAPQMFDLIAKQAHKTGDPGVWFIDRVNEDATLKKSFGRITGSNPCSEQSLYPRQSCALASVNIGLMVTPYGTFDWVLFNHVVGITARFLDNTIDLSGYPTPAYRKMAQLTRPIGVGLMGFADALCKMGIRYGSPESIEFASDLAQRLTREVIITSCRLAQERGAFPLYDENRNDVLQVAEKFFAHGDNGFDIVSYHGLRNSQWTTIAPTGSISIASDCSQGMEPFFAICYEKKISDSDEVWVFVNSLFEKEFKNEPWYDEALRQIRANHGSCQGIDCIPQDVQDRFVCAHDIGWLNRLEVQAALQKGISNSISSTVNLHRDVSVDTIRQIYLTAWQLGLKGVTIYRDGTHENQPVRFGPSEASCTFSKERPAKLQGETVKVKTSYGSVYVTVNRDETGRVVEVFSNGGKNGSINAVDLEAVARLISVGLQEGARLERLAGTLLGLNDGSGCWARLNDADEKPRFVKSIPDAVAQVLMQYSAVPVQASEELTCPSCGGPAYESEGCLFCPQCGSKCS